jgi:penicillin amidase
MTHAKILTTLALVISSLSGCGDTCGLDFEHDTSERVSQPATIRLVRDTKGVPHVYAKTDAGAIYGLGFATAEDRLFQMHLSRMKYQGRLSEMFGRIDAVGGDTVAMDRKNRLLGYARHMDTVVSQLDPKTVALLKAYSDGVNAAIKDMGALPTVFQELGITKIDAWEPTDSLLAYLITAKAFSPDALGEVNTLNGINNRTSDCIDDGGDRRDCYNAVVEAMLYPIIDDDAAVIQDPGLSAKRSPGMGQIPQNKKASHAWAIAGTETTTGKPYLNGRPMIFLKERAFHQSHVKGATFETQGLTVPGLFGYLIGTTPHTAWSLTAMNVDNADLFVLTPGRTADTYLVDGQEIALTVYTETLRIKSEADQTFTVRSSQFGVIVNDLLSPAVIDSTKLYAQRHIVTESTPERVHPIEGLLGMMRADNWAQFRDNGIDQWSYPNANLVYADDGEMGPDKAINGNICYRPATVIPVRSDNADLYGLVPQQVDSWEDNWQGYLGVEDIPEVCNPDKGFLVSANHLPVGSWWGEYGLGGTGESYRSYHIKGELGDMLAAGKLSPQGNEAFHRDAGHTGFENFRSVAQWVRNHPEYGNLPPKAVAALDILNDWSGQARLDDPLYRIVSWEGGGGQPIVNKFNKHLGDTYGKRASSQVLFFKRFAISPERAMLLTDDDGNLVDLHVPTFRFVKDALSQYWDNATDNANPTDCTRPAQCLLPHTTLHTIPYGTFLGTFSAWPLGSDYDLEADLYGAASLQTVWSIKGNAYSQAVQLGSPDKTETMFGAGNSMDPNSPYYDNAMDDWVTGAHHLTPMDQKMVEATALDIRDLRYRP